MKLLASHRNGPNLSANLYHVNTGFAELGEDGIVDRSSISEGDATQRTTLHIEHLSHMAGLVQANILGQSQWIFLRVGSRIRSRIRARIRTRISGSTRQAKLHVVHIRICICDGDAEFVLPSSESRLALGQFIGIPVICSSRESERGKSLQTCSSGPYRHRQRKHCLCRKKQ